MRNLRALISYDGSKFFGWQRQDGFWSVQEAVEQAVEAATGEKVTSASSSKEGSDLSRPLPMQRSQLICGRNLSPLLVWQHLQGAQARVSPLWIKGDAAAAPTVATSVPQALCGRKGGFKALEQTL